VTSRLADRLRQNRLLASLPEGEAERLAPYLQSVSLTNRGILLRPGDAMRDVYFPLSGIISLIVLTHDGAALETGLTGREGMAPSSRSLGSSTRRNNFWFKREVKRLQLPPRHCAGRRAWTERSMTCWSAIPLPRSNTQPA
jgi:CRP-like cAMP-binding protein